MIRTNIKFIAAVLSLFMVSCIDQLNVTPGDPNAFLSEDFYANPDSYKQGLAGVYANLTLTGVEGPGSSNIAGIDAGTSQYGRGIWNLQVLASDEAIWSWENDPGLAELQRSTWTASNVLLRGIYGRGMAQVAFSNEFLRQTEPEMLDNRGVNEGLKAEIKTYRAEVRFLRALAYYHMMDLFGKAAFITDADPVGAFQAPQAERAELFSYIESELLAIDDDLAAPQQNEYARADKAAAWMLLAKIYLNAQVFIEQDRYADCITYCEKIISSGYQLAPNYLNLFKADNNNNDATQEIIFPVLSDGIVTQNYGPTTLMINGQVGSQEENGESFGVNAGAWGGALRVSRQFSEVFQNGSYDQDDRNTLISDDRNIDLTSISDRTTGYIIGKWSNLTSTGAASSSLDIVDTDFPMFRLADVYLMYAEAHLRGGGGSLSQAIDYVNDLRFRANNPQMVTELSLPFILDERLVELHWESHRRQDLIRQGKFTGNSYNWSWKGNAAKGISIGEFRKVYPLPSESLAANPNLTQNPGY